MKQIAIDDKTEETDLLREYIHMEREKLDEGTKVFQEDIQKYEKFKHNMTLETQRVEEESRKLQRETERLLS